MSTKDGAPQMSFVYDHAASRETLQMLLAFGVTTVRTPAGPMEHALALRDSLERGQIPGPRVRTAGEAIDVIASPGMVRTVSSPWAASLLTACLVPFGPRQHVALTGCQPHAHRALPLAPVIDRHERLRLLARRRLRFASTLTVAMIVIYFGFILAIAFDKALMGRLIRPGLSIGILAGALVIVASWLLTWVYIRWANNTYDRELLESQQ